MRHPSSSHSDSVVNHDASCTYTKDKVPKDLEGQDLNTSKEKKSSVYAGLGWLDKLLVVWILLAIILGIILGNFVDGIEPALQKGKFVNVSVPIGRHHAKLSY